MSSDNEALPVSQADRKAANTAYQAIAKGYLSVIGCALEAGADDNAVLVQLFARHAASARKEEQERAARVADQYAQGGYLTPTADEEPFAAARALARRLSARTIAAAIRALPPVQGEPK